MYFIVELSKGMLINYSIVYLCKVLAGRGIVIEEIVREATKVITQCIVIVKAGTVNLLVEK